MAPAHLLAAAPSSPSPLWYASRGAGLATLLLLTLSVVLGVGTATLWEGRRTPRFVTAAFHRNVSLLSVVLLLVHIVTAVLDPFAHLGVRDAILPFGGAYRPLWLGLGVAAAEVLVAVALSSMLRGRIGPRTWRILHWTAYASWPLAVVHGLGTGSDAQAPWMIGLTAACVAAVVLAGMRRLRTGRLRTLPVRFVAGVAALASLTAISVWAVRGPFQPGWGAASGTPSPASASSLQASGHAPVHTGPDGFSDNLVGTIVRDSAGHTQIAFRDVVDPGLTLAIRAPQAGETLPVVTVARDGRTICSAPGRAESSIYAVCANTRLTIDVYGGPSSVTGRLSTSGPLG